MSDRAIHGSMTGPVRTIGAAAVVAVLVATPLAAQSVNDYRLPQGTPSATASPRPIGPADPDSPNPGPSSSPRPRASANAAPVPVATPSAAPAARATATPAASASAPSPPQRQRRAATVALPTATATPPASPSPAPTATTLSALPTPVTPAAPPPLPTAPLPAAPTADGAGWWPWLAALAGLVAAGFALLWWRQRGRAALPVVAFEPPVPAPEPTPPAPAPAPRPTSDLVVTLEARRMSASLMAATLSYRLTLTNRGAQPLAALAIEGDMISAHASIPPEQQIAQGGQRLELRHELVELAPGETAEFTGDFRLPLTAITPIRAGEAAFFVPLARFRVEAGKPGGAVEVVIQTYVIGELGVDPAAGLRPFRLDLGPRTYSQLGQRAVG